MDPVYCPMCGGYGVYLGALGLLDHYRCENCGWVFETPHPEEDEEDQNVWLEDEDDLS